MWGKQKSRKTKSRVPKVRLAQKRKKVRLVSLSIGVFLLIPVFLGIAWSSYNPRLNIQKIEVQGTKVLRKETLQTFLDSKLSDGKLHIISPRNELILNRSELASALLKQFPRIKSIEIPFTKFDQKLIVKIIERTPKYLWCDSKEDEVCYVADEDGYIFDYKNNEKNLQIIRNKLNNLQPLRSKIIDPKLFINLKIIFSELSKQLNLYVTSIEIFKTDVVVQLKDNLSAQTEWFLKVDLDGDVKAQISNLKTIVESQEIRDKEKNLKYIDLRFKNRVYYKLYGE